MLVGFLLGYTAATLWIQLGRNWIAMFATNTAVATLPLCYAVVEGMLTSRMLCSGSSSSLWASTCSLRRARRLSCFVVRRNR